MSDVATLHRRWYPRAVQVAMQLLADRDEAEEAAQEAFCEAWKRSDRYDASRGSEWAWIRAIVHSRCLDRLRAAQRAERLKHELPQARVSEEHEGADRGCDRDRVSRLLEQLPVAQRAAVELSFFEGLSHREIALRTGDPLGTVKTRIRLGLERLTSLVRAPLALAPLRSPSAAGTPQS